MDKSENKVEQICPVCSCVITEEPYEKEGTLYCCEACATGGQCECGCCTTIKLKELPEKTQG